MIALTGSVAQAKWSSLLATREIIHSWERRITPLVAHFLKRGEFSQSAENVMKGEKERARKRNGSMALPWRGKLLPSSGRSSGKLRFSLRNARQLHCVQSVTNRSCCVIVFGVLSLTQSAWEVTLGRESYIFKFSWRNSQFTSRSRTRTKTFMTWKSVSCLFSSYLG